MPPSATPPNPGTGTGGGTNPGGTNPTPTTNPITSFTATAPSQSTSAMLTFTVTSPVNIEIDGQGPGGRQLNPITAQIDKPGTYNLPVSLGAPPGKGTYSFGIKAIDPNDGKTILGTMSANLTI